MVANIRANQESLRTIDRPSFRAHLLTMLTSAVVCLKHDGFGEEREWRIIHSPARHSSEYISSLVEVGGGVPQRVSDAFVSTLVDAGVADAANRVFISQIPVRT